MSEQIKISFDGIDEQKFLKNRYDFVIVFKEYKESEYNNQLINYTAFNSWNHSGDYIKIQSDGETSYINKNDIKKFINIDTDTVYDANDFDTNSGGDNE